MCMCTCVHVHVHVHVHVYVCICVRLFGQQRVAIWHEHDRRRRAAEAHPEERVFGGARRWPSTIEGAEGGCEDFHGFRRAERRGCDGA